MQNMTTEQAIELIDRVCAQFTGTRNDHVNLQTAIKILREATQKQEKPKKG